MVEERELAHTAAGHRAQAGEDQPRHATNGAREEDGRVGAADGARCATHVIMYRLSLSVKLHISFYRKVNLLIK